jgi:hypothetical protein
MLGEGEWPTAEVIEAARLTLEPLRADDAGELAALPDDDDLHVYIGGRLPPQLVHYANTLLRHKVLSGSDYPVLSPDRWLADFDKLDIRPDVRPLILEENAARLLGLMKE